MATVEKRLTLSKIQFYCDIGHQDGQTIPLGIMAEIVVPGWRGLGLVARTSLTPEEKTLLNRIAANLLHDPFKYLSEQFDDSWDNAPPGYTLEYLSRQNHDALHFSAPEEKKLAQGILGREKRYSKSDIRQLIGNLLDTESDEFLAVPEEKFWLEFKELDEAA